MHNTWNEKDYTKKYSLAMLITKWVLKVTIFPIFHWCEKNTTTWDAPNYKQLLETIPGFPKHSANFIWNNRMLTHISQKQASDTWTGNPRGHKVRKQTQHKHLHECGKLFSNSCWWKEPDKMLMHTEFPKLFIPQALLSRFYLRANLV